MTTSFVSYSKQEAAAEQIDAAISCFFENKLACAITLSCAAEGMLPGTEEAFLYSSLLGQAHNFGMDAKSANDLVNNLAYWLKHNNSKQPSEISIEHAKAAFDVLRGLTKYQAIHGTQTVQMDKFESYVRSNFYLGS